MSYCYRNGWKWKEHIYASIPILIHPLPSFNLIQQLFSQILNNKSIDKSSFMINLDPGVLYLPYTPQIDIRKTIDYKGLMTSHGLGPNGAIMTALNLYAAKFNEVLEEVDNNKKDVRFK